MQWHVRKKPTQLTPKRGRFGWKSQTLGSFSLKQKEGTNGLSRKRLPLRRREEVETTDDATPVEMERPKAKTGRGTVLSLVTMPAPPLTLSAF